MDYILIAAVPMAVILVPVFIGKAVRRKRQRRMYKLHKPYFDSIERENNYYKR
jgi:hypothetical protein